MPRGEWDEGKARACAVTAREGEENASPDRGPLQPRPCKQEARAFAGVMRREFQRPFALLDEASAPRRRATGAGDGVDPRTDEVLATVGSRRRLAPPSRLNPMISL